MTLIIWQRSPLLSQTHFPPNGGKAPCTAEPLLSPSPASHTLLPLSESGESSLLRDQRRILEARANSHFPPRDPAATCFNFFLVPVVAASVRVPGSDWVRRSAFDPVPTTDAQKIRSKLVTQAGSPAHLRIRFPTPFERLAFGRAAAMGPADRPGSPGALKGRGRPWTPRRDKPRRRPALPDHVTATSRTLSRDGAASERFSHVTEVQASGPMRRRGRGFRGRCAGREPGASAAAGETRRGAASWVPVRGPPPVTTRPRGAA